MRWVLLLITVAMLLLFVVTPVVTVVWGGLSATWLVEALRHPLHQTAILNSLLIAAGSTALAMLIALPIAWLASRYRFRGQSVAEGAILAPLILPPFVGAIGILSLFGRDGAVNAALAMVGLPGVEWLGGHGKPVVVSVVIALGLYPILYLTLTSALARIDPGLIEAARMCGASSFTAWRRVVLPLLRPALFAGGSVVFVAAFTDLGTPLLLGYDRCLSVQVFNGLNELQSNTMPLALVVIMLVVSAGCYAVGRWWLGDVRASTGRGAARPATVTVGGWRAGMIWLAFAVVAVVAAAPHAAVALTAVSASWHGSVLPVAWTGDHLQAAMTHPMVVPSIANSLRYACLATLIALALGVFIAWTCTRWKPRGWQVLDGMAMIPLAVPGIIMAFGYLVLSVQFPLLKQWLDPFKDPTLILVIAYAMRRLPMVVRAATAGFEQVPVAYEEAAAACGASPWNRWRRITLPLITGSLAAGAVLTFSFSMLEVSDSLILAQTRDAWPITKVLFDLSGLLGQGPALTCALGLWAMALLAASLLCASALSGKRVGDLFR